MTQDITPTQDDDAELARHEAVIAHGLGTFFDVGAALGAINDGGLHLVAGFPTFDAYCRERWDFGRTYAHRLMAASTTAKMLPNGQHAPTSERQMRALTKLQDDPDALAEAWNEATSASDRGRGPTSDEVEEAVKKRLPPAKPREPKPPKTNPSWWSVDPVEAFMRSGRTIIEQVDPATAEKMAYDIIAEARAAMPQPLTGVRRVPPAKPPAKVESVDAATCKHPKPYGQLNGGIVRCSKCDQLRGRDNIWRSA